MVLCSAICRASTSRRAFCHPRRRVQLAWACRTDSSKFFFPPANFHSSPTPAMLSCTALEESNPCLHSGILTYQDGSGQDFRITGKGGSESHKRREENAPSAGHDYSGATAGCKPTGRSLTCPFVIDGLAEVGTTIVEVKRAVCRRCCDTSSSIYHNGCFENSDRELMS